MKDTITDSKSIGVMYFNVISHKLPAAQLRPKISLTAVFLPANIIAAQLATETRIISKYSAMNS